MCFQVRLVLLRKSSCSGGKEHDLLLKRFEGYLTRIIRPLESSASINRTFLHKINRKGSERSEDENNSDDEKNNEVEVESEDRLQRDLGFGKKRKVTITVEIENRKSKRIATQEVREQSIQGGTENAPGIVTTPQQAATQKLDSGSSKTSGGVKAAATEAIGEPKHPFTIKMEPRSASPEAISEGSILEENPTSESEDTRAKLEERVRALEDRNYASTIHHPRPNIQQACVRRV